MVFRDSVIFSLQWVHVALHFNFPFTLNTTNSLNANLTIPGAVTGRFLSSIFCLLDTIEYILWKIIHHIEDPSTCQTCPNTVEALKAIKGTVAVALKRFCSQGQSSRPRPGGSRPRPRPRPVGFEAKAKAAHFCPRAVLEVEDSPRGPHPWCDPIWHVSSRSGEASR